jgi:hypothetical protein
LPRGIKRYRPRYLQPRKSHYQSRICKTPCRYSGNIDLKSAKEGIFKDIANGMWYTDYVNWAGEKGIAAGMKKVISILMRPLQ